MPVHNAAASRFTAMVRPLPLPAAVAATTPGCPLRKVAPAQMGRAYRGRRCL